MLASANGGTPVSGELTDMERCGEELCSKIRQLRLHLGGSGVAGEVAPNAVVCGWSEVSISQHSPSRCQVIAEGPVSRRTPKKAEYVMVIAKAKSCANACQWDYQHQSGRGLRPATAFGLCELHRVISQHNVERDVTDLCTLENYQT